MFDIKKKKVFQSITINFIGELCITLAVILGLFIVWQVYYTTYKVADGKKQAIEQFTKMLQVLHKKIATKLHYDDPPEMQNRTRNKYSVPYMFLHGKQTRFRLVKAKHLMLLTEDCDYLEQLYPDKLVTFL